MTKAKTPYRIVWRPIAEADLDSIIDYIAQDNPTKAEAFGQELHDKTLPLAQHPKLGRTGRPGLPAFLVLGLFFLWIGKRRGGRPETGFVLGPRAPRRRRYRGLS